MVAKVYVLHGQGLQFRIAALYNRFSKMNKVLVKWGAGAVVLTVLAFSVYIFSGVAVFHGPDADDVLVPMFFDISRAVGKQGMFAGMYNSGLVAGLSYWGSPSFHPLYPLYFNWLGSDVTLSDTLERLKLVFFLHLAIYGLGTYLLGRSLGLQAAAAVGVGIAAPFMPAIQSVAVWTPILASLSWLPWILMLQVLIYRRRAGVGGAIALGVIATLLILAQPAQNLVLAFTGSAIFAVVYGLLSIREVGRLRAFRQLLSIYMFLLVAALVAIALAGPYLVQVLHFHEDSIRWLGDGSDITGKDKLPLSALTAHALDWKGVLAPFAFSAANTVVVGNLYVGSLIVVACLGYLLMLRKRPLVTGLLCSMLIAFAFCFALVGPLLYQVPIANKVREVNWWSCYFVALALPVGAYCLQRMIIVARRVKAPAVQVWWSMVLVVGLAMALVATFLQQGSYRYLAFPGAAIAIAWAMAHQRSPRAFRHSAWIGLIAALVVCPAVLAMQLPSLGQSAVLRAERMKQRKEMEQILQAVPDKENFRIAVSEQVPEFKVLTHQLSNLDARGIRGDLNPQQRSKFQLLYFPSSAISRLYGIRYTVVPAGSADAVPMGEQLALRRDDQALPRLFVVEHGVRVVESPLQELMNQSGENVSHLFIAPKASHALDADLRSLGEGDYAPRGVTAHLNNAAEIEATFRTQGAAMVVLNEDSTGHWYAIIDGSVRRGVSVNAFQTGFAISGAGDHSITIRRPTTLGRFLADFPFGEQR
jgi:hypothetical protein